MLPALENSSRDVSQVTLAWTETCLEVVMRSINYSQFGDLFERRKQSYSLFRPSVMCVLVFDWDRSVLQGVMLAKALLPHSSVLYTSFQCPVSVAMKYVGVHDRVE